MITQADLAQFTGTERWYRHPLALGARVTYTEGVKYFAEKAGAFWLLDIFATELPKLAVEYGIIFVDAKAKDGKAELSAVRDSGEAPLWSRSIDFTTLPDGDWRFYMATGGPGDSVVILLPSEY